jgi:molecular chaperone GrpE
VEEQVALGTAFNPTLHEALSSEETSEFPEGHISRVFKKPYKLHDRIVRPGQVVVARPKSN